MSTSLLFDLPLDLDARDRLSELADEGCRLESVRGRQKVLERAPCEAPTVCWGGCNACRSTRLVERERTRITAFKGDTLVWEAWV